jgi:GT2 family glycosyltransferase
VMKTALRSIWHKLAHIYIYLFNGAYRAQRRDPLTIPVIIINFNQLFYLKQLLSFLKERKFKNIVIIDNNSSFQPLLDYYEEIKSEITLYQMDDNYGHMVFFENPSLYAKYAKAYYIVTDADIVPNDHTPQNFVQMFMRWIDEDLYARKVGFALKLSDIPDYYPLKEKVLNWEKKFWNHQLDKNVFRADICSVQTDESIISKNRFLFRHQNRRKYGSDSWWMVSKSESINGRGEILSKYSQPIQLVDRG